MGSCSGGLLLLEGGSDLHELGWEGWDVEARGQYLNVVATMTTGRTSVFFCSDLSPKSFSCPSTRFLHRCVLMNAR